MEQPTPSHSPKRLEILVADSSPVNCKILTLSLGNMGHGVTAVLDGESVRAAWHKSPFDITVLDCQLTPGDSSDLITEIRGLESDSRTTIIGLAQNPKVSDAERCHEKGLDAILAKPIKFDELKTLISILEGHVERPPIPVLDEHTPSLSRPHLSEMKAGLDAEGLGTIIDIFLRNSPATIHDLSMAVSTGNILQIRNLAHNLKGGCATIGATRMTKLCEWLQNLRPVRSGPPDPNVDPAVAFRQLESEYEAVRLDLQRYIASDLQV